MWREENERACKLKRWVAYGVIEISGHIFPRPGSQERTRRNGWRCSVGSGDKEQKKENVEK